MKELKIKRKAKSFNMKKTKVRIIKNNIANDMLEIKPKNVSKQELVKVGRLVMGSIKEISELGMRVALPQNHFGMLPAISVSETFTELLKNSIENDEIVSIVFILNLK